MRSKIIVLFLLLFQISFAQDHSIARQWNEVLLESIRNDFARPTVHARNLFHVSSAMYDAWAIYQEEATPYFLGNEVGGYYFEFEKVAINPSEEAIHKTISYVAYRMIRHRFSASPGASYIRYLTDSLFNVYEYDATITSIDYKSGEPEKIGNYIASQVIAYGLQDGANEANRYKSQYYRTVNAPLDPTEKGNEMTDPNRWQPLTFKEFIDQSGNPSNETPEFIGPEWGNVTPFSLTENQRNVYERERNNYFVYFDPGPPPFLGSSETDSLYRWGFEMVSVWSSHLDPYDGVLWDISPNSIGNINWFPEDFENHDQFYDFADGRDIGTGYELNPKTGVPYDVQMVPRGDYARVLAEFWADGPDSETPPGHWFTILNYVSDNPLLEKRFMGEGETLDDLEWDIKSYFLLGGTMHDVAISAWSIKGWYDYVRPISALRYMASKGQNEDENLPNYDLEGIDLRPGLIELVKAGDELAGDNNENIGKVKLFAWKGPLPDSLVRDTIAGVGWWLAEDWWPYQRPTFVTPPFAGYVSGHSTYSRAAAEVLTVLTGDPFFPGGMGVFEIEKDDFLVFEKGPTIEMTLQWATYRDASDQTSLSRIWGGIHPPADDIPGRIIGEQIGLQSFEYGKRYFDGSVVTGVAEDQLLIYPNPIQAGELIKLNKRQHITRIVITDFYGRIINDQKNNLSINAPNKPGYYVLRVYSSGEQLSKVLIVK